MLKNIKVKSGVLALTTVLLLSGCSKTQESKVRPQDDFYNYVNGEWIASAKIPEGEISIGGMGDLQRSVEATVKEDLNKMFSGEIEAPTAETKEMVKYYKVLSDIDRRNKEGAAPLMPYLKEIESMLNLEDFNKHAGEFTVNGMYSLPFSASVGTDMHDTRKHTLHFGPNLETILDYSDDSEETKKNHKVYISLYQKMLMMVGKTEEEAISIVGKAMKFDNIIGKLSAEDEEDSDTQDVLEGYNPYSVEDFAAMSKSIDFKNIIEDIVGGMPGQVILTDPEYFKNIDEVISEENFEDFKYWMYLKMLNYGSSFISQDFDKVRNDANIEMGEEPIDVATDEIYYMTVTLAFNDAIGVYYGETYLGEEAKKDVTEMTEKLIAEYRNRLENNTWLSDTTKKEAIKKIDTMILKIGYPDQLPNKYKDMVIKPEDSALDIMLNFSKAENKALFDSYFEPVNRVEWAEPAQNVNAYYNRQQNSIAFPASILQAPYYSSEQTTSENYGSIGAIIGHEISHAFDPTGAQFDENGNLKNWWTEQDHKEFEKRTNDLLVQFDGVKMENGTVNGKLTMDENTADAGGLSVALAVLKKEPDANLEEFFTSWALGWRTKYTPEYQKLWLKENPHAPDKLRVNIQFSNIDDFYTTYDVKETDKMYVEPEKRADIW